MSLIPKETLLMHLQRAEMASDVKLPIEFFRDLVYQAMPRTWVELTHDEDDSCACKADERESRNNTYQWAQAYRQAIEAKLKEKNDR